MFICKVNCTFTAEWSPHFITCRTGAGLGIGSIVVVTKAGGEGTSTVQFRGYMPRVGLLTESAVWVDESKLFEEKPSTGLSVSRPLSPNFSENDPLGVAPSETGYRQILAIICIYSHGKWSSLIRIVLHQSYSVYCKSAISTGITAFKI